MMSQPETPTGVALQYVREELSNLRAAVHDELAAMRTDLSGLAGELRGHTAEQGPRIAVVEHRLTEAEKDIAALQADKRTASSHRWTLVTAVAVAVLAWVPNLIDLIR